MADIDIAQERVIADAATPGPWFTPDERRLQGAVSARIGERECQVASIDGDAAMFDRRAETHEIQRANATFIARARTLVPHLLDRIELLERLLGEACDRAVEAWLREMTAKESCRQVLKTIADACDQESLARAGGYLFRYVQEETVLRDCGQRGVCRTPPGCARHWEERNRELVRERDEARAFLRRTAMTGGSIVSSAAMTATQIAIARAADRMLVTPDGYGFVYIPGPRFCACGRARSEGGAA